MKADYAIRLVNEKTSDVITTVHNLIIMKKKEFCHPMP